MSNATFNAKAGGIVSRLMADLSLPDFQAAAIVGNLGHESNGFASLQEIKPTVAGSRGGYGWAQWTGPRRVAFENWCKAQSLSPSSDAANYGYLVVELKGSEAAAIKALRPTKNLKDAVDAFETHFERAGVPALASRLSWATLALKLYQTAAPAAAPSAPTPTAPPVAKAPEQTTKSPPMFPTKGAAGAVIATGAAAAAHTAGVPIEFIIGAAVAAIAVVAFIVIKNKK